MVTKRKRRVQLARARALRRTERMAARTTRQRRLRQIGAFLAVAAAVTALVVWIVTHDDEPPDVSAGAGTATLSGPVPSTTSTSPIEVAA